MDALHTDVGRGRQDLFMSLEHLPAILAHVNLISLAESIVESDIRIQLLPVDTHEISQTPSTRSHLSSLLFNMHLAPCRQGPGLNTIAHFGNKAVEPLE